MAISREPPNGRSEEENDTDKYPRPPSQRKKVVVVGLGMVGIAFMYVQPQIRELNVYSFPADMTFG